MQPMVLGRAWRRLLLLIVLRRRRLHVRLLLLLLDLVLQGSVLRRGKRARSRRRSIVARILVGLWLGGGLRGSRRRLACNLEERSYRH